MGTVWHSPSAVNNNCVTLVQSDRVCKAKNNPCVSPLLSHKSVSNYLSYVRIVTLSNHISSLFLLCTWSCPAMQVNSSI